MQTERRVSTMPYKGEDRRNQKPADDLPPYPAPGDTGADSGGQKWVQEEEDRK
jgi:hypothetical protein